MAVNLVVLWFAIVYYTEYESSINSGAFSDKKQSFFVIFYFR